MAIAKLSKLDLTQQVLLQIEEILPQQIMMQRKY